MRELARRRSFGSGVSVEEVLATREQADNPLRLPPLEELAPYSIATAERRGGAVEIRLWMSERDAEAYLAARHRDGQVEDAAVFSVLPPKQTA